MLEPDFYARDAEAVARALLGKTLAVAGEHGVRRGRIVETEAYLGERDLACHAAKGRTRRTETMFGPPGRAYVYLIYGMYDMFNIVTDTVGSAHAVLVRGLAPLGELSGNTDGPGKLTRALGITRAHNGLGLQGPELWLEDGPAPEYITLAPRVGIDYAAAWRDAPLRFYDPASPYVSRR